MPIQLARIDDRLIHGQVATTWVRKFNIEQALIINDKLAKDPIQTSVLQLAAPEGVKVIAFEVEKFNEIFKHNPIKKSTMLIYTNPHDVLRNLEGGVVIPFLNIGGMKFLPGKKQLTKAVSLDDNDIKAFQKIIERGVRVEIQMMPSDKIIKLEELLKEK